MNYSIYFIGLLLLFGGCEQENESKVDDGLVTVQEKEIPADDNGYTLKLSEIEEEIIYTQYRELGVFIHRGVPLQQLADCNYSNMVTKKKQF